MHTYYSLRQPQFYESDISSHPSSTHCIWSLLRERHARVFARTSVLSLPSHWPTRPDPKEQLSQHYLYKEMQLSGKNFFTLLPVCSIMAFQLVLNHLNNSITFFSSSNSDLSPQQNPFVYTFPTVSAHPPEGQASFTYTSDPISLLFITSPNCFLSYHILPSCSSLPLRSLVQVLTVQAFLG